MNTIERLASLNGNLNRLGLTVSFRKSTDVKSLDVFDTNEFLFNKLTTTPVISVPVEPNQSLFELADYVEELLSPVPTKKEIQSFNDGVVADKERAAHKALLLSINSEKAQIESIFTKDTSSKPKKKMKM